MMLRVLPWANVPVFMEQTLVIVDYTWLLIILHTYNKEGASSQFSAKLLGKFQDDLANI